MWKALAYYWIRDLLRRHGGSAARPSGLEFGGKGRDDRPLARGGGSLEGERERGVDGV
jgi:hypothetical protein